MRSPVQVWKVVRLQCCFPSALCLLQWSVMLNLSTFQHRGVQWFIRHRGFMRKFPPTLHRVSGMDSIAPDLADGHGAAYLSLPPSPLHLSLPVSNFTHLSVLPPPSVHQQYVIPVMVLSGDPRHAAAVHAQRVVRGFLGRLQGEALSCLGPEAFGRILPTA